jgi:hypothetical protein
MRDSGELRAHSAAYSAEFSAVKTELADVKKLLAALSEERKQQRTADSTARAKSREVEFAAFAADAARTMEVDADEAMKQFSAINNDGEIPENAKLKAIAALRAILGHGKVKTFLSDIGQVFSANDSSDPEVHSRITQARKDELAAELRKNLSTMNIDPKVAAFAVALGAGA